MAESTPLKSTIQSVFEKLSNPELKKKSSLLECWEEIAGNRLSKHTKARFGENKEVCVWVDSSTLAFELSCKYKPAILKRLQNEFGIDEVKDVRFVVGEIR